MAEQFPTVVVVGIEADGTIMPEGREAIESADGILGWERHLDQLEVETKQQTRQIESLSSCVPTLDEYGPDETVVLLSTGDPLFYGIGGYLRETVPANKLRFIPARSSVQLAFASLKWEYSDALTHSLHGRELGTVRTPLTRQPDTLVLFTEPQGNTPERIYEFLDEIECDYYDFYLCEKTTGTEEPLRIDSPDDFPDPVDPLNLVVLIRRDPDETSRQPRPGIESEWFRAEDDSMVSREEVRMLNLGWLNISGGETVWEIGAGTGSISIESARLNPETRYHAVEKKEPRFETLRENVRKLEAFNVIPRNEQAPEDFNDLPDPDRVILGGSGGRIDDILEALDERIERGTLIVANFITLGNFHEARSFFHEEAYETSLKQVTIHEDRTFGPGYTRWAEGPCIYMIRAAKK